MHLVAIQIMSDSSAIQFKMLNVSKGQQCGRPVARMTE